MIIAKLYYSQPWLRELDTRITSQREVEGKYLVVLAETIFYPTGGGQPHDLGTINGIPILDVFEEDGTVFHVLPEPLEGSSAHGVLDWPRRLDHMQQHSGQHLLSAIFQDEYGYRTESFHLGAEYCSIDITTPDLTRQEQLAAEARANELILEDLPVFTYTLQPEEFGQVPLRKIPDLPGPLRIVEIQGFDYSPCSGTHVGKTGQIGLLKILKAERYKGMTRVYFLCGGRALEDYRRKHEICSELVALLAVPEGEVVERVSADLERRKELEKLVEELQGELLELRARELVSRSEGPFFLELPEASIPEAQRLARAVLNLTQALVVINLGERLVLAHNLPAGPNLGQLIKDQAQPLGGRGGGSPTAAQVYFPDPGRLQEFLGVLRQEIAGKS
ncbi:MAG: DHHA1 domain-containing protein [Limnochordia bacterium]|nr:DHHA1 domain-containing protein [Limnochordia bacterium]MDI9465868.1 DHHA1 domain-containing protein [Bacillota bacterium]NLO96427.1 alanyl-tRNA editing protein [Bacillota bacterium]HOB41162.1 DHHA1 domain-containing protein [Limnochordia bacterium]HOK31055.1 DHHA1 domain-containing protein [Limnochordia bacterium]